MIAKGVFWNMRTIQGKWSLQRDKSTHRDELTLGTAPRGCKLRITRLCSGPRENCHLCALGLTPGTQVQVKSCCGGLSRLLVRGCDLILDPSLARQVVCELAEV